MGTNNKFIAMLKRNYSTIIIGALALVLLFVPEAKAMMQQGLMKLGLFEPKLEKVEPTTQPKSEANYRFEMVYADGKAVNMEDLKGKVVFMNFWATWCPPCIQEMPSINELKAKFEGNENIVFLMVDVDGKYKKAQTFMNKRKFNLPVYVPHSEIPKEFLGGAIPTTVILDKKGAIAIRLEGGRDYSAPEMRRGLQQLIAE